MTQTITQGSTQGRGAGLRFDMRGVRFGSVGSMDNGGRP